MEHSDVWQLQTPPRVEIYRCEWRRILRSHCDPSDKETRGRIDRQDRLVGGAQDWKNRSCLDARHDGDADGRRAHGIVSKYIQRSRLDIIFRFSIFLSASLEFSFLYYIE